jgi:hypothetical protein
MAVGCAGAVVGCAGACVGAGAGVAGAPHAASAANSAATTAINKMRFISFLLFDLADKIFFVGQYKIFARCFGLFERNKCECLLTPPFVS